MTPTFRGLLLLFAPIPLIAVTGGMSFAGPAGLALFTAALIAMFVDAARAPRPPADSVTRTAPERMLLGVQAKVSLELGFPGSLVVRRVRDLPDPGLHADRVLFDVSDGRSVVHYHLLPQRRGRFLFDGVWVECRGRLGLGWRWHHVDRPAAVSVLPDLRTLTSSARGFPLWRRALSGIRRHRLPGAGSEVERLREYEPSDDPRLLDWKATARHLRPITRQLEAERGRPVLFLLDAGRWMGAHVGGCSRFDHALAAALVAGRVISELGDPVGYVAFSDHAIRHVPPVRGRSREGNSARLLHDVQPEGVETDYRALFRHVLTHQRRRALLVMLTDLGDAVTVAALEASLAVIGRRHDLECVHLLDPDQERHVGARVTTLSALARRVVIERMTEERRRAVATLRARGVTVFEVRPERLQVTLLERLVRRG